MFNYSKKFLFFSIAILIIYLCLGIYLRYETLDIIRFNEWLTRDFDRAFNFYNGNNIPLAGPETTGGRRLPGPFLYFLLSLPLLIHKSYEAIFTFNFILNSASLFLFLFIVKRYFGFYPSLISTILFSINLLHVDAVALPINPVFLFPFIILFIGFFLEFTVHKNPNYFCLIYLLLFLMAQIHYSIITFYVIPLIIALIYKIRIPLKQIFITLLIFLICFSPYLIYRNQTFTHNSINEIQGFLKIPDLSILKFLKIIFIQETLNRISFKIGAIPIFLANKGFYPQFYFCLISIGFFGLIAITTFKNNISGRRGIIGILILFYFPAFLYEISHPTISHLWYSYIFIPTSLIIIGLFIKASVEIIPNKNKQLIMSFFYSILILYFTVFNYRAYQYQNKFTKQNADLGYHGLVHTKNYYHFKNLIKALYKELGLTPKEYYKRVYFGNASPYSYNLLQLIGNEMPKLHNLKLLGDKNICFYIINKNLLIKNMYSSGSIREGFLKERTNFDAFLNDPTINIIPTEFKTINLSQYKFKGTLYAYAYKPKMKQSCYTNSANFFVTEKTINDLLIKSNDIKKGSNLYSVKPIQTIEEYNDNLTLIKLLKELIIYDQQIDTPFEIKLDLKKTAEKYTLKIDLSLYYYLQMANHFKFNKFRVSIKRNINLDSKKLKVNSFDIISPDSWLTNKIGNKMGDNKLIWTTTIDLPEGIKLKKDKFLFELLWSFNFPNKQGVNKISNNNTISLKL